MAVITRALSRAEFEAELDDRIRHNHPFVHHRWVRRLLAGEMTLQQLQGFALEFEHFLRFTPRHFFCLGANAPDAIPDEHDIRRNFAENLNDDLGVVDRSKDHFQLFRRFAYAIGLTKGQLLTSQPMPSTTAFNYTLMYVALNRPYWEGMAGISWANESLFSLGLSQLWEEALQKHYGLRKDQIFLPPAEEEMEHVRMPRDVILSYAETERMQDRIREVFRIVFDAWNVFFDGLWYAHVDPR